MRRRDFMTSLGGAAAAPLLGARVGQAQQNGRVRRIGWLIARAENDPLSRDGRAALQGALAKLGWTEGRNLHIDVRFAAEDLNRLRTYAAELVRFAPDAIVSNSAVATRAL